MGISDYADCVFFVGKEDGEIKSAKLLYGNKAVLVTSGAIVSFSDGDFFFNRGQAVVKSQEIKARQIAA